MAEAVLVRTEIFSSRLYSKGHLVDRWFGLLVEHFEQAAQRAAPARTGELVYSITADVDRIGPHELNAFIGSDAPYALYVLRGTTGPIMSRMLFDSGGNPENAFMLDEETGKRVGRPGMWMGVRPAPHSYYTERTPRMMVSGQSANNFLLKAWRATARRHRVMRDIPTFILNP